MTGTTGAGIKIRTVIIHDEERARQVLREYLSGEGDPEIVAEYSNGLDAVKAIAEHKPDLLVLELLELIGNEVAVVFITAFDQYATRAFDAAAVDYLLKPFAESVCKLLWTAPANAWARELGSNSGRFEHCRLRTRPVYRAVGSE
jgi:DNA-binding LytR/AlgR family response regulator